MYPVEVKDPDPIFANHPQEAIGGVEGEMRVCLLYLFQSFGVSDEHAEFRKLLMETATEEIGHIEMLATAVAKNLQKADPRTHNEVEGGQGGE